MPDPREIARELAGLVAENGVILCVTRMQTDDTPMPLAPRQGQVSLFTPKALAALWRGQGLEMTLLPGGWHIAWRGSLLDWARALRG